jgi:hypothetical protein
MTFNSPLPLENVYLGMEVVLRLLILLEELYPSRPQLSTHPPATARRRALLARSGLMKNAQIRSALANIEGFFRLLKLLAD